MNKELLNCKINYKDLIISSTAYAFISSITGYLLASFFAVFVSACFLGTIVNPVRPIDMVPSFTILFPVSLYVNYRAQKIQIKQKLLQTFEN